ncbi:ABC transporter ATP-binding protein [Fodinicola acaciae]|uniref:ABC transporter ATP-binding protein n=1 Tax=Fodinicola acaciae TaxID=2681555 RepID=UPI0013D310A6|nr:ABC transporter ATP-binding protein [Fodinicola acaciae]
MSNLSKPSDAPAGPVLEVRDLRITFPTQEGPLKAVDGLSFELDAGRSLGIVGESGSGKSATSLALLGLHRRSRAQITGEIRVTGTDMQSASDETVRQMRGSQIAMVFQDALSALNPYYTVGDQIAEAYRSHTQCSKKEAWAKAVEALDHVHIPDAARRAKAYPHQFSGGMRQRSVIAMGIVCQPRVLVADEPTTALDVTVQAQILDLLEELRRETGMGLILITHDLGVAAGNTDEILVMQKGKEVERGPVGDVMRRPVHPYTQALLSSVPRLDEPSARVQARIELIKSGKLESKDDALVEVVDLHQTFRSGRGFLGSSKVEVRAVDGVSLEVPRGRTLGVVGESGSGKSTLARCIIRLLQPTSGKILFEGKDISRLPNSQLKPVRRDIQMVFQDPVSSLNPRIPIGESIALPLRIMGGKDSRAIRQEVQDMLERVGLDPQRFNAYPHEFSGGQRQRIGIARSLMLRPKLLICDEPVSALDVTTQAQVLRLLNDLQEEFHLTLMFVSHDLAVVRQVCDRVAVMQHGKLVEYADTEDLYSNPQHPYTKSLLAAVPLLDPDAAREARQARRQLLSVAS